MRNKMKSVTGNIYGLGIYCIKANGKVLYVGSGMMNDRLSSHLYYLKRDRYKDTNKEILQVYYDMGELEFEVLHFSEHNAEYETMSIMKKENLQEALGTLEEFYMNLYKDTICNKQKTVKKHSSNKNATSTYLRRRANLGGNNPNSKYGEILIAEILWLKENGYKPKQIELLLEKQGVDISNAYISALGVQKWIHLDSKKPSWIA